MSLVQFIHNQLQRWAISQRLFDFNISQRRGPNGWKMLVRLMSEPSFEFWAGKMSHILWSQLAAIVLISSKVKRHPWLFEERRSATKTAMQTQVAPTSVSCWHVDVPIRDKRSRQHWDWDSWPTLKLARLTSKHYDTQAPMISSKYSLGDSFPVPHIQKSKTPILCNFCVFLYSASFTWYFFLYMWWWWRVWDTSIHLTVTFSWCPKFPWYNQRCKKLWTCWTSLCYFPLNLC